jgi:CheY-like chemotaxis protein
MNERRLNDEFLDQLAHDLRNPLAPIRNAVAVLQHTEPQGEAKWALEVIERQVAILAKLADEVRATAEAGTPELSQPGRSVNRFRILVVDDSIDAATSTALLLRLSGHEVSIAHDGNAAIDMARSVRPQVVLLDIGLPLMDGYEVARRLRALPATDKASIIALTGYGQPQDIQRSREAGFDHHLVKPVDPARLEALLASLEHATG